MRRKTGISSGKHRAGGGGVGLMGAAKKDDKNKGNDKNQNKNKNKGKPGKSVKAARKISKAAYKGQFNELKRARKQTRRDFNQYDTKLDRLFNDYDSTMSGIQNAFGGSYGAITDDYTQALARMGENLGGNAAPSAEAAAAGQLFGTMAGGGLQNLVNERAAQAGWMRGARDVGQTEEVTARSNLGQEKLDALRDLRAQRLDLAGQRRADMQALIPQLRQQFFENDLARDQFKLEKQSMNSSDEMRKALMEWIQDQYGGGGNNNKGNNNKGPKRKNKNKSKDNNKPIPESNNDRDEFVNKPFRKLSDKDINNDDKVNRKDRRIHRKRRRHKKKNPNQI